MLKLDTLEVELKLRAAPEAYRRLMRHPALGGSAPPDHRRLHAVYFDTAKHALWRSGLALRVRRDGDTWTQTLKGEGRVDAGLHQRIELEAQVSGPAPDLNAFPPGPWTDRLLAALDGQPLEEICVTQFSRSIRELRREGGVLIEASLDRGRIRAAGGEEPLCELELELKSGTPAALYELALELIDSVPLAAEPRSKAERGYALHSGTVGIPVSALPIALDRTMNVDQALRTVIASVLSHIQANEFCVLHADHPEYVHQMRVGLRRLRSALSIFRPVLDPQHHDATVEEVRWMARTLGAARDWDVFLETTCAQVQAAFGDHGGMKAYMREFFRQQRLARRRVQRAVASPRYQRFVLGLGAWLHGLSWRDAGKDAGAALHDLPIETFAADVLETRYARMRKRARDFGNRSAEELHELRIAAKKLRYAAQFFAGLYDADRTGALLSRLSRLQDALGALNDAAGVERLVHAASPRGTAEAIAEARGMLRAWTQGQSQLLRREARRAWRGVRRCATFW